MNAKVELLKCALARYETAREAYFDAPDGDNNAQWMLLIASARVLADNVADNKELLEQIV